jgi:hypothetical protein
MPKITICHNKIHFASSSNKNSHLDSAKWMNRDPVKIETLIIFFTICNQNKFNTKLWGWTFSYWDLLCCSKRKIKHKHTLTDWLGHSCMGPNCPNPRKAKHLVDPTPHMWYISSPQKKNSKLNQQDRVAFEFGHGIFQLWACGGSIWFLAGHGTVRLKTLWSPCSHAVSDKYKTLIKGYESIKRKFKRKW